MALKIDALSLRERVIIFAMSALILIVLINTLVLDAQFAQQTRLSQKIKQERSQIAGMQSDIQQKVQDHSLDPDAARRLQLASVKRQSNQMQIALADTQKGLVPPEKMASLLEDILKRDGRLRLISLKTLPVSGLIESPVSEIKGDAASTPGTSMVTAKEKKDIQPAGSVYKHGVEITVQGSYLDMMNYMTELESMPWQVFWGKAKLTVGEYPQATLTLTLFTLSLDKKWLNL
ncbi:MAG: MSHA biogenesis protein MshJ [Burkholderiaceae bacterium]